MEHNFEDFGEKVNSAQEAIVFGLIASGNLLAVELATRGTLSNFYGGGYEVATLENGLLRRL